MIMFPRHWPFGRAAVIHVNHVSGTHLQIIKRRVRVNVIVRWQLRHALRVISLKHIIWRVKCYAFTIRFQYVMRVIIFYQLAVNLVCIVYR